MAIGYEIHKGLQKPLVYRGFKGRFIYWGVGSLAGGLLLGGLIGAVTNMYLGGLATLSLIATGLAFTFIRQKDGLHSKTRNNGIIIHPSRLNITYEKGKENAILPTVCRH